METSTSRRTRRLKLSVDVAKPENIANNHKNLERDGNRLQNLEIVWVIQQRLQERRRWHFVCSNLSGWMLFTILLVAGVILERRLAVTYLITVTMTGAVESLLYGRRRRKLANNHTGSQCIPLVAIAKHMNERNWQILIGESSIVNPLLNKPLASGAKLPQYVFNNPSHTSSRTHLRTMGRCYWIGSYEELGRVCHQLLGYVLHFLTQILLF
jgi:hypothetical protein